MSRRRRSRARIPTATAMGAGTGNVGSVRDSIVTMHKPSYCLERCVSSQKSPRRASLAYIVLTTTTPSRDLHRVETPLGKKKLELDGLDRLVQTAACSHIAGNGHLRPLGRVVYLATHIAGLCGAARRRSVTHILC